MKAFFLSLALVGTFTATLAQETNSGNNVSAELQDHFNRLKSQSNSYREHQRAFKVIDVSRLDAFWNGVLTTVKESEKNQAKAGKNTETALLQAQATIKNQETQIRALKQENAVKEKAAQQNAYEVSHIMVFGIGINKQVFLFLSLGIILGLSILAAVIASLYKKSKVIADEKVNAFRDMELEFTEYKKAARERELKIKRELQTEMNSKEEMKQQLASFQKLRL